MLRFPLGVHNEIVEKVSAYNLKINDASLREKKRPKTALALLYSRTGPDFSLFIGHFFKFLYMALGNWVFYSLIAKLNGSQGYA